jgi:transposase
LPEGKRERIAHAEVIGVDGQFLLTALDAPDTADWVRQLPAVVTLRQVGEQNYHRSDEQLRWRPSKEIPPECENINSPYDPEARYSQKRIKTWVGYKVHVTETCEPDTPHLITHVETTNATFADDEVLTPIHDDLETKALLPATHLVDAGYVTASRLVESQEQYEVDLYGPARANYHWQARASTGFAVDDFSVDWEHQHATCPAGQTSRSWSPALDNRGRDVIKIKFSAKDCRPCPFRPLCTSAKSNRRTVSIRPDKQYQALQAARARHRTGAFAEQYAQRAGVEGTISQGVRAFDLDVRATWGWPKPISNIF